MPAMSPRLIKLASDARLVAYVREGRAGAFEAVYDRHHRAILSFCRHLLGDQHEAEDAVQHTFMAAYTSLLSNQRQIHLRPWLYTIARNRCYSVLRSQRERPTAELDEAITEGLPSEVQRRQDLRDLVGDLRRLPDEQRAAIVLAELDSLSHADIAEVLGVPREKVKALVFQARESLLTSRTARDTPCQEIRQQLAAGRGGALRRTNLRRHLRDCEGCRAYRADVQRQRSQFAALLPVAPTLLLKEGLVATALGAGGAAAVGGSGLIASSALKTGLVKGISAALIAGAGTLGTVVVSASHLPVRSLVSHAGSSAAKHGTAGSHQVRHASATHHIATATGTSAAVSLAPSAAGSRATGHRVLGATAKSPARSSAHRTTTGSGHRHANAATPRGAKAAGHQNPPAAASGSANPAGHVPGSGAPVRSALSPAVFTPPGHAAGHPHGGAPGQAGKASSARASRARGNSVAHAASPGVGHVGARGTRTETRTRGAAAPGHANLAFAGRARGHASVVSATHAHVTMAAAGHGRGAGPGHGHSSSHG